MADLSSRRRKRAVTPPVGIMEDCEVAALEGVIEPPAVVRPGWAARFSALLGKLQRKTRLSLIGLWLAAFGLLYLALRNAPLSEIARVLAHLGGWQIVALVGINVLILGLMTARWGMLLRAFGQPVRLHILLGLRLAGFGVSYFTPGPQFGGEPVQVDLLRRQGIGLPAAISSVFLDRLVDVLANFTFLTVGLLTLFGSGVLVGGASGWAWGVLLVLLLPLAHLVALWSGRRPISRVLVRLDHHLRTDWSARAAAIVHQSEEQIGSLCRTQPVVLLYVILISGTIWLLMLAEYTLTLYFLGARPTLTQAISALTAARLAFLLPVPGGLGALEASQVLATQSLGWGVSVGIALSVIIRGRDVLLAVLGLGMTWLAYRTKSLAYRQERS